LTDIAAAESLFRRGLEEMLAQRYATACPALEESQRLDPRHGTLFTLAECEANAGRLATAVAHYEDYLAAVSRAPVAQQSAQRDRVRVATERRDAILGEVPTLTLVLPEFTPQDVLVTRDGIALGAPALNVPLPIDPGSHVVGIQLPLGKLVEQTIVVARSEHKRVILDVPGAGTKSTDNANLPHAPSDSGKSYAAPTKPIIAVALEPIVVGAVQPVEGNTASIRNQVALGLLLGGSVSLLAGGASLWIAHRKVRAINEDGARDLPYREANGDYRYFRYAGIGAVALGGSAIAGAGFLLIPRWGSKLTSTGSVAIAPIIGSGHAMLEVVLTH
jgi:hypothetical protein